VRCEESSAAVDEADTPVGIAGCSGQRQQKNRPPGANFGTGMSAFSTVRDRGGTRVLFPARYKMQDPSPKGNLCFLVAPAILTRYETQDANPKGISGFTFGADDRAVSLLALNITVAVIGEKSRP
jgi:hypothetical protein